MIIVFTFLNLFSQGKLQNNCEITSDTVRQNRWVDSLMLNMTLRERIAQMFMVAAYSNRDQVHVDELASLIKNEKIGGLIFFQGGPKRQALLTNYYQSLSKVPLFISIDAEWGLGMRLDSTFSYPRQMLIGAANDPDLVYKMGADIARQLKRLGIHINFAPVVDININPLNPVISTRSFGEDRNAITTNGLAYMNGLQDNGIIACAKHFPGHGDTDADSHLSLPSVKHDRVRLDTIELYPFKQLIKKGIKGVMVAHLKVPAIEPDSSLASSISPKVVKSLLKDSLQYEGLIFTDALNMKGVSDYYTPVDLNYLAFIAGNDILLYSEKVKESIDYLENKVLTGLISETEIDSRCRKILRYKYNSELYKYNPVDTVNLISDLNRAESELIKRKLIRKGLTIIQNNGAIPISRLDTLNIAYVEIGSDKGNSFREQLELYTAISTFSINPSSPQNEFDSLLSYLDPFNLIVIGYHSTDTKPSRNFGITPQATNFIFDLSLNKKIILDIFGNPYTLGKLFNLSNLSGIIISFDNSATTQNLSAQLIFGGIGTSGRMPVTIPNRFPKNSGDKIDNKLRLSYSPPEELAIESSYLEKIDSIAAEAIAQKITPGMQILAAKDGVVFYNSSFGDYTYSKGDPVDIRTLYDIASVTKIAATLPMVMQLYDTDKISIDGTLGDYINFKNGNSKKSLKIKDLLLHQSGLQPWIPFYLNTLTTMVPDKPLKSNTFSQEYPFQFSDKTFLNKYATPDPVYYQKVYSFEYPSQVADELYAREGIIDSIFNVINNSALNESGKYKYSDIGFLYLQRIVENMNNQGLEEISQQFLYNRLGMNYTAFKPSKKFDRDRIAPTEYDPVFRKQLIRGYVHDPAAAMMGGVAGHAGLFSNANDLAKLLQMYLQKGTYGGDTFFKPGTIEFFTTCPNGNNGNRRALGFDKPETKIDLQSPTCSLATKSSFGHSGFTGTMVWVDPEYNFIYVFLSNRVYPDATNNKLVEQNIRTKIQEIFYQAIQRSQK